MPAITIPEEHAKGLANILTLSYEEGQALVTALQKAESIDIRQLENLVLEALPSLDTEKAKDIVGTLLSLYSVRTRMDIAVDSLATELLTAAQTGTAQIQPFDVAKKNLLDLLSVRPLSMIHKARVIHTDHENTFCSARILTDLRPVFDADVKKPPVGFVMAHILKLSYHHAGKHSDLHLAMDKKDVEDLMRVLERAKDKAATLTSTISGANTGFAILAE
jgi:hypothetical protein